MLNAMLYIIAKYETIGQLLMQGLSAKWADFCFSNTDCGFLWPRGQRFCLHISSSLQLLLILRIMPHNSVTTPVAKVDLVYHNNHKHFPSFFSTGQCRTTETLMLPGWPLLQYCGPHCRIYSLATIRDNCWGVLDNKGTTFSVCYDINNDIQKEVVW